MKNILIIALLAVSVGVLTWLVLRDGKDGDSTLASEALTQFDVPSSDTNRVDRIVLTDKLMNVPVDIRRTSNGWTMDDGSCVQKHLVNDLLTTITRIRVKGKVNESLAENMVENIMVRKRQVDIYKDGSLHKTYYIGSNTQDGKGTFMILETPEDGRSPEPVVVHLPGERGTTENYFITDKRDWLCSDIFTYEPANIQSVKVTYPSMPQESFKVDVLGKNEFSLSTQQGPAVSFDTAKVRNMLLSFRKVHFEFHNRTLSPEQVDSVRSLTPFAIVEVTDKTGKSKSVTTWRRPPSDSQVTLEGTPYEFDPERMWAWYEPQGMVVVQYYVFDHFLLKPGWFAYRPR